MYASTFNYLKSNLKSSHSHVMRPGAARDMVARRDVDGKIVVWTRLDLNEAGVFISSLLGLHQEWTCSIKSIQQEWLNIKEIP